jgi:Domain of unknown function (DUF4160)
LRGEVLALPVRLAANFGFRPAELRDIERIVSEHEELLEQRWNEYFHG